MKKIYSLMGGVMLSAQLFSQAIVTQNLPPITIAGTSANRAPNGTTAHTSLRAHFIIPASELSTLASGTQIQELGFIYTSGVSSAATGTLTFYLENTANTTNTKSTTWATAIAPMTSVYSGSFSIPTGTATPSTADVALTTPFTYTGGGIYVAYDWKGATFATTAAVYTSDQSIVGALYNGTSATTTSPATLTANSAFRPQMRFSYANPLNNDMVVTTVGVDKGHENLLYGNTQTVFAAVKNGSNTDLTNINVTLDITGANPTSTTTTIPFIVAGATTTLTFPGLAVTQAGGQTIKVSVPADQQTSNDELMYNQVISCDTLGYSDNSAPFDGIGFNTGSGILAVKYQAPPALPINVTGVNVGITTATTSIGKTVYGVLVRKNGTIVAVSPSVVLAAGDIGKEKAFAFPTAMTIPADSVFFVGLAQTAGTPGYFPVGTQYPENVPAGRVYSMPLAGGTSTAQTNYTNLGQLMIEALITGTTTLTSDVSGDICGGTTVTYSATTGHSNYDFWLNGATAQNSAASIYTLSASVPSTVQVTSTINGCAVVASDTHTFGIITPTVITATASTPSVCSAENLTLTVSGSATYTWSSGENTSTISVTAPVAPTGTNVSYTVESSTECGIVTSTVSYVVNPTPTVSIAASQTLICIAESATLTADPAVSYTWTEIGQPGVISTSSVVVVTPTTTTDYAVTISDGNCIGNNSISIEVSLCTGINEIASSAAAIYPNPNNGIVTVKLADGLNGNYSIEVMDVLGHLIVSEKLNGAETLVDTKNLQAGVYLYNIYQDGRKINTGRMIRQ